MRRCTRDPVADAQLRRTQKKTHIQIKDKEGKINRYSLNDIKINISYFKTFKKLRSYDDKSISIILDGKIVSEKNKTVITTGEIVKSFTLKQLSNYFKIDKKILLLKAQKKLS